MSDSLEELRQRLALFAKAREWEPFHSPKNLAMALIAEAAELVEHFQWLSEEESDRLSVDKLEAVRLELADIQIYLIRIADRLNVDLIRAVRDKMAHNERRFPIDKVKGRALRASEYEAPESK
jgi:NTP pyrophosphatase (non-canonical NTP hydrolase)